MTALLFAVRCQGWVGHGMVRSREIVIALGMADKVYCGWHCSYTLDDVFGLRRSYFGCYTGSQRTMVLLDSVDEKIV